MNTLEMNTLEQTLTVPPDGTLHFDLAVPKTWTGGKVRVTLTPEPDAPAYPRILTEAEFAAGVPCPMDHTPNAETLAAIAEGRAMKRGEIPAISFGSSEALFAYLDRLTGDFPEDW